jgi:hypothetical protein
MSRPRADARRRSPAGAPLLGALALACAALAALAAPSAAQEGQAPAPAPAAPAKQHPSEEDRGAPPTLAEAIRAAAAERYAFESWPGRDGPSRDGIDLAALAAAVGPEAAARLRAAPGGPVATVATPPGATRALIWVEASPGEAHEALLTWLAGCTRPLERLEGKVARGDVAFAASSRGAGGAYAFAAANLAVAVVSEESGAAERAARALERLALAGPLLDGKRARTLARGALEPATDTAERAPGEIALDLRAQGAIAREARAEGAAVEEAGDRLTLRRADPLVRASLAVHLLSPRGWRTTVSHIDPPRGTGR